MFTLISKRLGIHKRLVAGESLTSLFFKEGNSLIRSF